MSIEIRLEEPQWTFVKYLSAQSNAWKGASFRPDVCKKQNAGIVKCTRIMDEMSGIYKTIESRTHKFKVNCFKGIDYTADFVYSCMENWEKKKKELIPPYNALKDCYVPVSLSAVFQNIETHDKEIGAFKEKMKQFDQLVGIEKRLEQINEVSGDSAAKEVMNLNTAYRALDSDIVALMDIKLVQKLDRLLGSVDKLRILAEQNDALAKMTDRASKWKQNYFDKMVPLDYDGTVNERILKEGIEKGKLVFSDYQKLAEKYKLQNITQEMNQMLSQLTAYADDAHTMMGCMDFYNSAAKAARLIEVSGKADEVGYDRAAELKKEFDKNRQKYLKYDLHQRLAHAVSVLEGYINDVESQRRKEKQLKEEAEIAEYKRELAKKRITNLVLILCAAGLAACVFTALVFPDSVVNSYWLYAAAYAVILILFAVCVYHPFTEHKPRLTFFAVVIGVAFLTVYTFPLYLSAFTEKYYYACIIAASVILTVGMLAYAVAFNVHSIVYNILGLVCAIGIIVLLFWVVFATIGQLTEGAGFFGKIFYGIVGILMGVIRFLALLIGAGFWALDTIGSVDSGLFNLLLYSFVGIFFGTAAGFKE